MFEYIEGMSQPEFCKVTETPDGRVKLEFDFTQEQVELLKKAYSTEDINEDVVLKFVYDALEKHAAE